MAERRLPNYLFYGRITAIVGMSVTLAATILLFLATNWLLGLIFLAASLPFLLLMRFLERRAEKESFPPS